MAIGAITEVAGVDGPGGNDPLFCNLISFAGDGAYAAGGTGNFQALVQAAIGSGREVLGVIGQDCGGYVPVYDKAANKLKVYEQSNTATSPLIETATANLSAVTFRMLVLSK